MSMKQGMQNVMGLDRIKQCIDETGVSIDGLCVDYFMRRPFFKEQDVETRNIFRRENMTILSHIAASAGDIGARLMMLPYVDNASMSDDDVDMVVAFMHELSDVVARHDVHLTVETDFPPSKFQSFLDEFDDDEVMANYDSGDSAHWGYDHYEEITGMNRRIANVHIKDRVKGGGTVPLGKGDANFDKIFKGLKDIQYCGNITLQVAREADGQETNTVREQLEFVKGYVGKHGLKRGKKMKYGIMQGRLTPSNGRGIQFFPFENWENEFYVARDIGLDEIEFIFDYPNYTQNPLWTSTGGGTY